ncbi:MAG: polyprenyl synthetase family protein [Gemmatimonadetes bacterium]|nr:polyprenyl synthetase family protein [Gemmatimonadota bacterium]
MNAAPARWETHRNSVERALREALDGSRAENRVVEAMRYSLTAGGKRIRPILLLLAHEAAGGRSEAAAQAAAALEMIHTYSLIHDDLPCMDDDDLRRGRPTCHVAFGEATALLAGDALLTHAFGLLAEASGIEPTVRCPMIATHAGAIGYEGMIGGQMLDLDAEKKNGLSILELQTIHERKTGAFLEAAPALGAMAAGASDETTAAFREYGRKIGLAFQIADDLLDVTGTAEEAGKRVGKDAARGKATYPGLLGIDRSRSRARELVEEAVRALPCDTPGGDLAVLARYIVERIH